VIGFLTSQPIVSFTRHGRISICYVVVGNGPRPFIPILSHFYIYFSSVWIQHKMQPPRVQYSSAKARGNFVSQSTRSIGHCGTNGSTLSSHSIVEMIEFAARKSPTEKFNGQEPAKWFIYIGR
jgi:hypothetical protein